MALGALQPAITQAITIGSIAYFAGSSLGQLCWLLSWFPE
jgi:hypothetical protein